MAQETTKENTNINAMHGLKYNVDVFFLDFGCLHLIIECEYLKIYVLVGD